MHPIVRFALLYSLVPMLIVACAAQSFDIGRADRTVTPREAAERFAMVRDRQIAWGGTVVAVKNLSNGTQLEVLGYPLDDNNRPNTRIDPVGRFIVLHSGYLESVDYKAGRLVTVVGTATETRNGTIGEAKYVYPVVSSKQLHLWPVADPTPSNPNIHFGIGIGIVH